jgi:amino acid adenylation domain-containing protein
MEIVTTEQWVYLMMDIHHLVVDGGSFDVLLTQLFDLLNGKEIDPETFTYADFVAAQKAAESSEEYAAARDFFETRLGKVEGVTEVPSDLSNPKEQGTVGTLYTPLDFATIDAFCRQHNISPAHHILAATFYALSRFTNSEQLCIITISNGRSDLRISNTVGMFVNTLALSATIGEQSVMEFISETSRNFDETLQHETYPFTRIASDYDLSAEIMFAYQMGVIDDYQYKGETIAVETFESDTPKFRIAFFIMNDESGRPSICLQYDKGRYSHELMEYLAQSISNAANSFISNPTLALKNVSLLDTKQVALLDSFNQNDVDYDNTQTVVSLFRRQVELHPDNIAMVYHDIRLTYKQVDEQSERIAQYVQSLGLGNEDVVSILIPRSEWMVVASMGVLKAGCAYQPLDPSYPVERLNFMMQDAGAKLLIADEELRPIVDEYQGKVLLTKDINALPAATAPVKADITPSSLFILLYTSGSTGTPKGCQLEHGNLVCFCHWYHRYYDLKPESKVAAYASYGFDACMMDMYSALTCGAAVYIIGEDIRLNLPDLNDYFNREGITHSFMTTQVGCQFAMNFNNHSLLHLSVGGEKVLPLTPPTAYQLHNAYGPTECTIFTTTYAMKEFEQNAPIGKPLDNFRLYIVDKQLNRLPVGAVGELWVSGPQVSRGYLNRPEKTAETYLTNPFTTDAKYNRVYRTGDIVRYLADGNIQFVGRRDGQVKIRGFRIELKEVEAVIREYPGIKDATVQAFDYETGGKFIAAYIVSDEQVDIKELNAFIGKQKPSYMIPAATMQIDAIPLNQNQKVNRKALPAPVVQAADHEYVEPKNEQERMFAKIFGDILSLDKVSATDNFFELGGTSLMVTKVIIECDKAGYHVIYGDVFTHPTPRLLAQFVSGEAPTEDSDVEFTNFDYTGIDAILKHNNIETFLKGERQQLGHVLLTGATGYLGIHVLRELIDSDAATITCLVRGKDQPTAEHRLKNLLFYYFEQSFKELFGTRLFVVNGDVTQEINVDSHIDTVFNCAANVKHFSKGTDIEDVNIGGAQRCVDFCLNTGARLVHISTTSVGEIWIIHNDGEQVPMLDERKLWFGQFLDNRYISSKFLAERLILDAVAHHGLNAKVMRVGNLAPRSYDGEFQANFNSNSYMGRLKVFHVLGCCPYDSYDELTEMSPIDQTAKAVVTLAATPKECTVFQPFNNHTELLGDVLQLMTKVGREIRFVENAEFEKTIDEAGQDPEKAKLLSAILAYQDVAHGQKAAIIERDNRYTCNVLHRLGFHWRDTSWDYVERMLKAIGGFGFFE